MVPEEMSELESIILKKLDLIVKENAEMLSELEKIMKIDDEEEAGKALGDLIDRFRPSVL
jgi:hypothetical protein